MEQQRRRAHRQRITRIDRDVEQDERIEQLEQQVANLELLVQTMVEHLQTGEPLPEQMATSFKQAIESARQPPAPEPFVKPPDEGPADPAPPPLPSADLRDLAKAVEKARNEEYRRY
jgi:uncharacterized coiled-coil protein SlyX